VVHGAAVADLLPRHGGVLLGWAMVVGWLDFMGFYDDFMSF